MSKDNTLENETCGCEDSGASCCFGGSPEKTLAFWVLRAWLGARALFTGFSKFTTEEVVRANPLDGVKVEDYGSELANKASEAVAATGPAADAAQLALAAADASNKATAALAAAKGAATAAQTAGAGTGEGFTAAVKAATAAADAAGKAAAAAVDAAQKATVAADAAAASLSAGKAAATVTKTVHHGLPQSGDWTLASFTNADIWYMPKWALNLFDATLGYVLIALGVTLLLGIGTRLSLFLQGLLYTGLTLGFIAISKEPGSSAGITMLGVHVALVVAALALAKYNKIAVCKKF